MKKYIIIDGQKIYFSELEEKKDIDYLRNIKQKLIESISVIKEKIRSCTDDERKNKLYFVKSKLGEGLNFLNELLGKIKRQYKPLSEYFMKYAEISLDKDQFEFILLNAKQEKNADTHNKILD